MILCLETATSLCSVALCDRRGITALRESGENKSHASELTVFIETVLREAGIKAGELDAVAVSKGPGSYTGLRIGVSAAKGIAYAASLPLISVDTTYSMFLGFLADANEKHNFLQNDLFCPVLDARRMEVYYSVYNFSGNLMKPVSAEVVEKGFPGMGDVSGKIYIFGDGAAKCGEILKGENMVFEPGFNVSAAYMREAVYEALDQKRFEDIAYFEPFYLKDFLATKPVKNILGK